MFEFIILLDRYFVSGKMATSIRSRQGLRRFKLLNPSTAFHDCFSYAEKRYPRVTLDQRREDSPKARAIRQTFLKERDIKIFGKIGVFRTEFHGISQLPDCECIGVSDLLSAAQTATAQDEAFFEQLSARLMRDADLVPINELIALLQEFQRCDYLDIGLVNKIKNEIVYDIDRVDFPELGVGLHAILGQWNIVSPKLIRAVLRRALEIQSSNDALAISLILKSLKNCPNRLLKELEGSINALVKKWMNSDLTFSDLSSTLKALQYLSQNRNVAIAETIGPAVNSMLSKPVSDVESGSEALCAVLWLSDRVPADARQGLIASVKNYAESVTETATSREVANLESRNRAANIAASIIVSAKRLGSDDLYIAFHNAITTESVRGIKPKRLVELVSVVEGSQLEIVRAELRRKYASISEKCRMDIAQFL